MATANGCIDGDSAMTSKDEEANSQLVITGPVTTRDIVLRFAIGVFVGFASALTGSSGPVLLLPILISLRWDIFISLGCAQAIQIPIAVASVIAYVIGRPGVIDFAIGGVLSATLVPLLCFGAYLAHRLEATTLKLVVSVVLVVAGVGLFSQLAVTELS